MYQTFPYVCFYAMQYISLTTFCRPVKMCFRYIVVAFYLFMDLSNFLHQKFSYVFRPLNVMFHCSRLLYCRGSLILSINDWQLTTQKKLSRRLIRFKTHQKRSTFPKNQWMKVRIHTYTHMQSALFHKIDWDKTKWKGLPFLYLNASG